MRIPPPKPSGKLFNSPRFHENLASSNWKAQISKAVLSGWSGALHTKGRRTKKSAKK